MGAGLMANLPPTCACTREWSCPEFAQAGTSGLVDVCAQDVWGAGYFVVRIFSPFLVWSVGPAAGVEEGWAQLRAHHGVWVRLFSSS